MSTSITERFNELFSEFEDCNEDEQKQKIPEINEIVDGMNMEEFESVFTKDLYDKMNKMIEEKKISIENTILLLKHVGYSRKLKNVINLYFDESSLSRRFEQMIIEEEKKKERKIEKLLADLCECYLLLNKWGSSKLFSICVPCLLKAALHKEGKKETQKEVEIALLALSCIYELFKMEQELFLDKITEIIKYHQEHHNLTPLAHQCAWKFLIDRLHKNKSLEEVIVNELHFSREAARELEELTRNVNWKKKEGEEMNKEEANEVLVIRRWIKTLEIYFLYCRLHNEEFTELFGFIVQIYGAAKDNHSVISNQCIYSLRNAAENRVVKVEDLLKGGAVDAVLEEIQRQTLDEVIVYKCLQFFKNVSERLKEEDEDEKKKVKRKSSKMEIFEKLEEEGYEDTITSFNETLNICNIRHYRALSLKFSDYLVNI
ncbi:uncharacterized protein MONOS_18176 [Monocercomonoides exilis]|uniref:uncharacterized protein n=1 Tax=Monocercomonoides exilis TaxID=2049356 RepID=UPI003559EABC|nr:hypothetical protein MONOS_18176 [Monocercomonoides exilis]